MDEVRWFIVCHLAVSSFCESLKLSFRRFAACFGESNVMQGSSCGSCFNSIGLSEMINAKILCESLLKLYFNKTCLRTYSVADKF